MSVSTMARLAEGDSATPDSTLQSAIRLVAGYIPAEAIAVYIAVLGILSPASDATEDQVTAIRLISFVIGLVVAVALAFVTFKGKQLTRAEQRRRELVVATIAGVSFAIYAAAMPSFFVKGTILTIPLGQWAAVLAIVTALALPSIAKGLGVRK
jgi:phosphoglycerol transferase MdoB-like AlkP superfamily enzyme